MLDELEQHDTIRMPAIDAEMARIAEETNAAPLEDLDDDARRHIVADTVRNLHVRIGFARD